MKADLSNKDEIEDFMQKLIGQGKFDVIINNAGVSKSFDDKEIEDWGRILRINTVVPGLIMGNADRLVNDGGVIINISSVYGHERFGDKGLLGYSASKAALNSLTRTFAKKLAPKVRVMGVAPGYVNSKWNENYSPEERKRIEREQLIERLIEPQEVADLVVHIINNKALEGEIIYIDGGISLKTI